jgi:hypothetical protein
MPILGRLSLQWVPWGDSGDWKIINDRGIVVAVMNNSPAADPEEWGSALVDAYNHPEDRLGV